MTDFVSISTRVKKGCVEVFPKFRVYPKPRDLMIRGGDFYAVYIESTGLWSTNEDDALSIIDAELTLYANDYQAKHPDAIVVPLYLWDSSNGMIDLWHKFCQKQMRDSYKMLDETLIFANTQLTKDSYASKQLSYPLEKGSIEAYNKLISTLYSEEERHKIEWAIGCIITR